MTHTKGLSKAKLRVPGSGPLHPRMTRRALIYALLADRSTRPPLSGIGWFTLNLGVSLAIIGYLIEHGSV